MVIKFLTVIVYLFIARLSIPGSSAVCEHLQHFESSEGTEKLLVVSTIDGNLTAVSLKNGAIKWRLDESPVLKVLLAAGPGYSFLPDPRDGTLYVLGQDKMKKLPFTIPELVQASPCRTADGTMYAGRKHDVWFSLNPKTGQKIDTLSSDGAEKVCPATAEDSHVYVGRTEYILTMFDEKSRSKKWNATFVDYSSHILLPELNYKYSHYSSSYGGHLVTVDSTTGDVIWQQTFDALIVAVYSLESNGLHRLPLTILGQRTLENLLSNLDIGAELSFNQETMPKHQHWKFLFNKRHEKVSLFPALFIGEFKSSLYALPSLVDDSAVTFVHVSEKVPLLPGPDEYEKQANDQPAKGGQKFLPVNYEIARLYTGDMDKDILLLGYHKIPETVENVHLYGSKYRSFQYPTKHVPLLPFSSAQIVSTQPKSRPYHDGDSNLSSHVFNPPMLLGAHWMTDFAKIFLTSLFTGSFIIIATVFFMRKLILKTIVLHSQSMQASATSNGQLSNDGSGSEHGSSNDKKGNKTTNSNNDSNVFRVGKITFNSHHILGRGCEGTVVYKGVFDGRDVAVKRVVSDFFNLADREVDLLRASDSHPNVIRYFCMESDSQFRYIALELCWATFSDYVDDTRVREQYPLDSLDLLKQATTGLAYLHSLKIVHRDIKPHNILLSQPKPNGTVNVLISDFGLCKKLPPDRNSFSKRSGFAGTDGWMAPEMLASMNATCAVDIFSMGCVFYYVLSQGKHPFGDSFRRQANIAAGDYNITHLNCPQPETCRTLIDSMLSHNPDGRPCARRTLKHPMFWRNTRMLLFLQDVSDRVDKEDNQSLVVQRLEKGAWCVVNKDWRTHICEGLITDLKSRRTYRGNSVRDLLRAMRNKKNHFRELPEDVKLVVGQVPEDLVAYFASKFPRLIAHVYEALRICSDEPLFHSYYHPD